MAKKTRKGAAQPGSRPPLNRDRILAAAVEIADERGVGAVTMREVASRLGVEAMSLYNHVANKDDILDGMADLVAEQFDLPQDADDWREAMRRRAVSAHQVFGRHPWAPMLFDSRGSSGPSALRYFDWVLGTLMRAGFSIDDAARAFSLLDSYIYGFGIQQFNFSAGSDALTRGEGRGDAGVHPCRAVPVPASDGVARDAARLRRRGRLRLRARDHPRRAGADARRVATGLSPRPERPKALQRRPGRSASRRPRPGVPRRT